MKKLFEFLKITVIFVLLYYAFKEATLLRDCVIRGVERGLYVIIPSLFFMMAVSGLAVKSGIINFISPVFDKISKSIFKMNGAVFITFLFSMFAGYPVGAKMLSQQYKSGLISQRQLTVYQCICFGAGPAFIFGCLGTEAGKPILLSNALANMITALILSFVLKKEIICEGKKPQADSHISLTAEDLCGCVIETGKSLFRLCAMIIFFTAVTGILTQSSIYQNVTQSISNYFGYDTNICNNIVAAVLDVSSISEMNIYDSKIIPIISFCISFGGVCVIMQIKTLLGESFKTAGFIFWRFFTALLSMIICSFMLPMFINDGDIVCFSKNTSVPSVSSPVASILIMFMVYILARDTAGLRFEEIDIRKETTHYKKIKKC